jgi:hypothetical protein
MVRRFLKMATVTSMAAAALASTPSCADNHESIFIYGVVALTAPDCTAKGDSGSKLLASGVMELKLTDNYRNFFLVGNQLIARGSPSNLRAEPNRVQINGATVTLTGSDGTSFPAYSVQANGTVSPTISADPTYAPVYVELIPSSIGQQLKKILTPKAGNAAPSLTLKASVTVWGQTLGLNDVESGPFTFSINVTNGGTIVPTYDSLGVVNCKKVPTDVTFVASCFPGQDVEAIPCYYACQTDPTAAGCI